LDRAVGGEVVLEVPSLIVAEAYYTLVSFYQVDKKLAAGKLAMLLQQHGVKLREADIVLAALERLQTTNIGFSDASTNWVWLATSRKPDTSQCSR
jgi:hypothetical protein